MGIVAALAERRTSGQGQFVEVNLLSSALAALVNQASAFVGAGVVPGRMGNLHPSITPYQTFATATEPIAIAATNERQFSDLCKALDAPELAADERWSSNTARVEHREALAAELESILRRQPCDRWVSRLTAHGVPCSPVNSVDAAFALAAELGPRTGAPAVEQRWPAHHHRRQPHRFLEDSDIASSGTPRAGC